MALQDGTGNPLPDFPSDCIVFHNLGYSIILRPWWLQIETLNLKSFEHSVKLTMNFSLVSEFDPEYSF